MAASNDESIWDKILTANSTIRRNSSTPGTTPEEKSPEDNSAGIIVGVILCVAAILIAVCVFAWWKRLLCCKTVKRTDKPHFVMLNCCAKCFSHNKQDQTADGDYRWRARERNSTCSKGDNHDNPSGLHPPVFYLESGDSTDTESMHGSRRQQGKLDPNSELQRKSRLQNEKLPSFSALDRTKRPRLRKKEDNLGQGGDGVSLVFEPLTFETFRSNSPPLAVIAPLSNSKAGGGSSHSDGFPSRNTVSSVEEDSKQRDCSTLDPSLSSKSKQPSSGAASKQGDVPLLNLTRAYAEDGGVPEHLQGRDNEAYSSENDDDDLAFSNSAYSSDVDELSPPPRSKPHLQPNSRTAHCRQQQTNSSRRPATLQIPAFSLYNSWSSVNSSSTFPEETSYSESAEEMSETLPQIQDPIPYVNGVSDPQAVTSECTLDRNAENPNNAQSDSKVVKPEEKTKDTPQDVGCSPKRKKTPPKKPKRKNPPSNVSTAESHEAIAASLMTSKGIMTSSGMDREDGERGTEGKVENALLPPPPCFMDHVFAGFDDFDEVNGSLV